MRKPTQSRSRRRGDRISVVCSAHCCTCAGLKVAHCRQTRSPLSWQLWQKSCHQFPSLRTSSRRRIDDLLLRVTRCPNLGFKPDRMGGMIGGLGDGQCFCQFLAPRSTRAFWGASRASVRIDSPRLVSRRCASAYGLLPKCGGPFCCVRAQETPINTGFSRGRLRIFAE
jgi:hypothetical protein